MTSEEFLCIIQSGTSSKADACGKALEGDEHVEKNSPIQSGLYREEKAAVERKSVGPSTEAASGHSDVNELTINKRTMKEGFTESSPNMSVKSYRCSKLAGTGACKGNAGKLLAANSSESLKEGRNKRLHKCVIENSSEQQCMCGPTGIASGSDSSRSDENYLYMQNFDTLPFGSQSSGQVSDTHELQVQCDVPTTLEGEKQDKCKCGLDEETCAQTNTCEAVSEQMSNLQGNQFVLTGLHACGDLTPTFLRFYVNCDLAIGLCSVGCCYMKMSEKR